MAESTTTASTANRSMDGGDSTSPQDYNDDKPRKRMRVPTSCAVCRKRKIKCDKVRPSCSGCRKSQVEHLCSYEEPVWVNSRDLWENKQTETPGTHPQSAPSHHNSSVGVSLAHPPTQFSSTSAGAKFDELSTRLNHIEASLTMSDFARSGPQPYNTAPGNNGNGNRFNVPGVDFISMSSADAGPHYDFDPNETVELFDYMPFIIKKSRLEYHGGLDPKSIIKKDPHLKIVWLYLWNTFDASLQNSIERSDKGFPTLTGYSTQGFHEVLELKKRKQENKKQTLASFAQESSLDNIILKYLPSKKAIMTLCFRFFKVVYPVLPFINENSFFNELETLIGPWGQLDERPAKVNITSKYDYATIGLLFLVLRFAYLTIEPQEYKEKPELACLVGLSINTGHVMVAQKCLDQYNFLRKSYSLRVLQVLLYLKLYYHYCPEDDDVSDGSEGRIMMGTIYSVALSLGLQADPSDLVNLIKSPKTHSYGQLWRKVWHKILELDATQSVSLGVVPNCPNDASYDTKLPEMEADMDEVDTFVVHDFEFMNKKTALYRKIGNLCFNRRRKPTLLQMVHLVREVENFMSVNFGNLKDVLSDPSLKPYAKVKKVSYLYEMNSLLLSLKSRLLTHFFQVQNNKKVFEMSDECLTLTMKILNSSLNLYYNMGLYFEPGHRLLLRPISYSAITKALLIIAALLVKLSQCKELVSNSDITRASLLRELHDSLLNNMDKAVQLVSALSTGYYNAQRIVLALRLLYNILKDPKFNFSKAAREVSTPRERKRSDGMVEPRDIQIVTPDEIPETNFLMSLLDNELAYLKAKTERNLVEVLQPLVGSPVSIQLAPAPVNPSGAGNGQFYDPTVDSLTVKTPSSNAISEGSTAATPLSGSQQLDLNSIFAADERLKSGNYETDTSMLSSEEFASLFGLFEDYNLMSLNQKDLKGL